LGKAFGIPSHVLSPGETKELYPLMNVDDVYGTLYSPHDGTMDPTGLCNALTRAATRAGAKVIESCSVNAIRTTESGLLGGGRKIVGLETDLGFVATDNVINCTGAWANYITQMV